MSQLHKRLQMSRLPPMPPKIPARGAGIGGKKRGPMRRDYTPVSWDHYFERMQDVEIDKDNIFRVYESGSAGPVCLFLHGGGFSALSWAVLSHHLVSEVECRCVAMDIRGHGDTVTSDEQNLSAEQLSRDVGDVVRVMYGEDNPPPIILIGHSMGGAIGVHAAYQRQVPSLIGLVVIDVVEGTALDALSSMQSFLLTRPRTFKSVEYAVEWCVRSGQVRNIESAKVSMVGQVKRLSTNETATSELAHHNESDLLPTNHNVITEEEEEEPSDSSKQSQTSQSQPSDSPQQSQTIQSQPSEPSPQSQTNQSDQSTDFKHPDTAQKEPNQYTWRINLTQTEKYWRGWFEGLSSKFLSCPVPKMLLLAGVDRLDKDLTVGQMQGKFQMQVLPQCGHAVHEDVPDKVADVLATYLVRHKFAEPKSDFESSHPCTGHSTGSPMLHRIAQMPNSTKNTILVHLLDGYDNLLRPYYESGVTTNVTCDLYINSLDSVSLDQMDYSVNIHSRQSWIDPRLAYQDKYPDVEQLTLDSRFLDMIWVPDQFFPNEKDGHAHCLTVPNRLIRIYPNGTVLYAARYTLKLSCHMSLEYFPLDKQICHLMMESFGFTVSEIQFQWRSDGPPIQVNEQLELPQFELMGHDVEECKRSYITGDFTCLKASFYLHRKYGYYMIQNYIPSLLIVVLSWVSFWINIDAIPARISLGVLTVLTMTTQSVGAWMSLPHVSYVKAIDIWMSTCVCFVFAAMLEFAIVNTLARKEIRKMSLKVRASPNNVNKSETMKQMLTDYTYGNPENYDKNSRNMARLVDKVARWLFPFLFGLFNLIYWCVFMVTG